MGLKQVLKEMFTIPPGFDQRVDVMPLAMRGDFDPMRTPEWSGRRTADWSTWDDPTLRADAVRKSIIVFACATYLADAVSEANLTVEKEIQHEWESAQDRAGSALETLVNYPNPYTSETEFLSLLVMQMAIQGYGVVEKVRNKAGLPVQLWPLRPDWLAQKPTADGTSWTYEYRPPGKTVRSMPVEDLIFVPWRLDDRMERHGIGPVMVAAREIGIDASLTNFLKTFLDAGGIPPFVLMTDDVIMDDAEVDQMQEKWRQKYAGSKAYGTLPVLHGGYHIESIGQSLNDMAWPDLRSLTELKICQAFRVPPDLVAARESFSSGSLTTTEADGAMEQLQRYGAAPLRKQIAGALGRGLLPEFVGADRSYRLQFDTSEILALQEDKDARHARARQDWEAGLIMLDEARQLLGRDDLPSGNGQVFKIGFSESLVPIGEIGDTALETVRQNVSDEPKALPAPELVYRNISNLDTKQLEQRARLVDRGRKDRQRLAEIGTRALRKFFKAQGQRIAETVSKSDGDLETRDIHNIDWDKEQDELAQILRKFYMANGTAAWVTAAETLDWDGVWSVNNPRVLKLLDVLGLRIVGISDKTRVDVISLITDALVEGDDIPGIAKRIKGLFEETYKSRSETIARTESMVAYADASVLAYAESGQVEQVEVLDNPEHTTPYPGAEDGLTCSQRHGIVVPLDRASFHVRSDHPNGSAGLVPILTVPLGQES